MRTRKRGGQRKGEGGRDRQMERNEEKEGTECVRDRQTDRSSGGWGGWGGSQQEGGGSLTLRIW